jgi:hypothetical protein
MIAYDKASVWFHSVRAQLREKLVFPNANSGSATSGVQNLITDLVCNFTSASMMIAEPVSSREVKLNI